MVMLCVQIFLGGWTSTNYAAVACEELPTCHAGLFMPAQMDYVGAYDMTHEIGKNYEYATHITEAQKQTIHVTHRLGAVLTLCLLLYLAVCFMKQPALKYWGYGLVVATTAQFCIGAALVYFQLPLALAVLHNGGAAVLLTLLLIMLFTLHQAVSSSPKSI